MCLTTPVNWFESQQIYFTHKSRHNRRAAGKRAQRDENLSEISATGDGERRKFFPRAGLIKAEKIARNFLFLSKKLFLMILSSSKVCLITFGELFSAPEFCLMKVKMKNVFTVKGTFGGSFLFCVLPFGGSRKYWKILLKIIRPSETATTTKLTHSQMMMIICSRAVPTSKLFICFSNSNTTQSTADDTHARERYELLS